MLSPLSPIQQKQLQRLAKIADHGELAIADELNVLDEKIDIVNLEVGRVDLKAEEALKIAKEATKIDKLMGEQGIQGKKGDSYVLNENDKIEIAKKVIVPIIEKVIERTEIVHEQPIIKTEIVEKIVKDMDTSFIDEKIAFLEEEILKLKNSVSSPRSFIGGRVGLQIYGSGVKKGTKVNAIDFSTGLTVTESNGLVTVTGGGGISFITFTGTIDGYNTVFTASATPTIIFTDKGIWTADSLMGFSISGLVVTLPMAPGYVDPATGLLVSGWITAL